MTPRVSVSEFIALTNQTLEITYPSIEVEGEVASFKVNQQKYVFFDLKDSSGTVGCFMTVWQLRMPIEDGMKVIVTATPKLTQWGKFSLTVRVLRPSGEGSLKKSFELLKKKLTSEGLFSPERKRPLPLLPRRVGVISSVQAAGYKDFIEILSQRWGGMEIEVAHVQVQGEAAPDQIIRALKYFNTEEVPVDVLVVVRGGGSADDLAAFNDELLVREIAASRIPTLVAIGHEIDESLAELAADVRGSTPTHAAQLLVPDRQEMIRNVRAAERQIAGRIGQAVTQAAETVRQALRSSLDVIQTRTADVSRELRERQRVLRVFDPTAVLRRGYAVVRGEAVVGKPIMVETVKQIITAEVRDVKAK